MLDKKDEPIMVIEHDAITGETITREMTDEEIASRPQPNDVPNA